ncbi:MAG: hypothetical protein ACKPKO_10040, partial [Candidatus Fonsibacter sp.]
TATSHRHGMGSLQRPSGAPSERATCTLRMTVRRGFFDAATAACNTFLKVNTDGVPGAAACSVLNKEVELH